MKGAIARLNKELNNISKERIPGVRAVRPKADNLFELHFVIDGPPDTPYEGGQYWGKLVFPPTYPSAPPALYFFTPSGRFVVGQKICASMTDFHPESWNPLWSVGTLLVGVLSFMAEDAPTAGSEWKSSWERRRLARDSWQTNAKNGEFRKLFLDLCDDDGKKALVMQQQDAIRTKNNMMLIVLIVLILALGALIWTRL